MQFWKARSLPQSDVNEKRATAFDLAERALTICKNAGTLRGIRTKFTKHDANNKQPNTTAASRIEGVNHVV
jgi:hypothetical protein